jgi:hypothetical protein
MLREEDKRNFRRYSNESECELILPSGLCKGVIIDYSDGVGVSFKHASDLERGTDVHVKVFDYDLEFKGRIAWARRAGDHIRAGIRRADNFRGNLRFYGLADILIGITRRAKTGALVIESGSIRKKVFIKKGDIIWATSTHGDHRLGEHLLKSGIITLTELEDASHYEFKTGRKMEDIIVERCGLPREEISREMQKQVEYILLNLFLIEEGVFEFIEEPIPPYEKTTVQLSTANIIYRGIKKINKYSFIKEMCPSVDDVLNPSHNPLRIFQSLDLEDSDKAILSCINGEDPVKDILAQSSSSNYEALKTISVLMAIGLIDVKKENEAPVKLTVDELSTAQEVLPSDYLEEIDELLTTCKKGDYYDVLGVTEDSSPDDIEKAYFGLSKKFHPDRHFSFNDLDVKGKLLIITSRATAAYEVLSDPDKKGHYDTQISVTALNKQAEREEGPESEGTGEAEVDIKTESSVNRSVKEHSPVEIKVTTLTEKTTELEHVSEGIMDEPAESMTVLPSEYPYTGLEIPEEQHNPGLSVVMVAQSEKTWFRNKWLIFPLIIIALTAAGATVSLVHDKSGELFRPTAHKEHIDPVVKEERVKLAVLEIHDGTDVQKVRSNSDTSSTPKSTFTDFRDEAFKKVWLDLFD